MSVSTTYPSLKNVTYHLITSSRELETALRSLEQSPVIGLDCETTGLDPYIHTIRLIQLAAPQSTSDSNRFTLNCPLRSLPAPTIPR